MKLILVVVAGLLSGEATAGVFMCKNPKTGETVFSDAPCGDQSREVIVRPANTLDSSAYRQSSVTGGQSSPPQPVQGLAQESAYDRETRVHNCMVSADGMAKRTGNKQRDDFMAAKAEKEKLRCQGMSFPEDRSTPSSAGTSHTNPIPQAPRILTNCDPGGCWDTQGRRYNGGSGGVYTPTSGGACIKVGDHLECH